MGQACCKGTLRSAKNRSSPYRNAIAGEARGRELESPIAHQRSPSIIQLEPLPTGASDLILYAGQQPHDWQLEHGKPKGKRRERKRLAKAKKKVKLAEIDTIIPSPPAVLLSESSDPLRELAQPLQSKRQDQASSPDQEHTLRAHELINLTATRLQIPCLVHHPDGPPAQQQPRPPSPESRVSPKGKSKEKSHSQHQQHDGSDGGGAGSEADLLAPVPHRPLSVQFSVTSTVSTSSSRYSNGVVGPPGHQPSPTSTVVIVRPGPECGPSADGTARDDNLSSSSNLSIYHTATSSPQLPPRLHPPLPSARDAPPTIPARYQPGGNVGHESSDVASTANARYTFVGADLTAEIQAPAPAPSARKPYAPVEPKAQATAAAPGAPNGDEIKELPKAKTLITY